MRELAPVITIDGPSGSGKGTIGALLASAMGWHYLDSGALYRLVAQAASNNHLTPAEVTSVVPLIPKLHIEFVSPSPTAWSSILLNGEDVTDSIRTQQIAELASQFAAYPEIRAALIDKQHQFRKFPGLITDGRDMGTIIFPDAIVKFFLVASVEERAERRFNQLKERGISANLDSLLAEIAQRDIRDQQRPVAPLKPAHDAVVIDTSCLAIEEVFQIVLYEIKRILPEINLGSADISLGQP